MFRRARQVEDPFSFIKAVAHDSDYYTFQINRYGQNFLSKTEWEFFDFANKAYRMLKMKGFGEVEDILDKVLNFSLIADKCWYCGQWTEANPEHTSDCIIPKIKSIQGGDEDGE